MRVELHTFWKISDFRVKRMSESSDKLSLFSRKFHEIDILTMAKSTLSYLDGEGRINFLLVPWTVLNRWLSRLNGNFHVDESVENVNRGSLIEELEHRRKAHVQSLAERGANFFVKRGLGEDWRTYENDQGFTHLEELIIYQPADWRKQAREYMYVYRFDLSRESKSDRICERNYECEDGGLACVKIPMYSPIVVTLFHPEIPRTSRYGPLNFLLSYGVTDPILSIFEMIDSGKLCKTDNSHEIKKLIEEEISPLDYFFAFQRNIQAYNLECLEAIGKDVGLPRLMLIKELDFGNIIGQRLAKHMIKQEIVHYMWHRTLNDADFCAVKHPLSFIFAGPSGNGKTELAEELARLLNKPNDDAFHKVDCGKLRNSNEVFGMSGAYRGSYQGSALNNFVVRIAQDPGKFGVVLLDEIEKADKTVIHALYQVIDKGEWTNKKQDLDEDAAGNQTQVVSCRNVIFVMTTNAANNIIMDFAHRKKGVYMCMPRELDVMAEELQANVRRQLQVSAPFTGAFVGRIGTVVPFLPMCNEDPDEHPLNGEMMTVAKLLIEREEEKISGGSELMQLNQILTPATKHSMATILVQGAIPEAGVRSLQKRVGDHLGKKLLHARLLESGGIQTGSDIRYHSSVAERSIGFRMMSSGKRGESPDEEECRDADVFD